MYRQRQETTWPFLCVLGCLFILCLAAPRAWQRVAQHRSAAEILGLSEENVKVRLHRARAGLRRAIQHRLGEEVHHLHAFAGERCDRVVNAVLARIAPGA